jgi:hypothetical protein
VGDDHRPSHEQRLVRVGRRGRDPIPPAVLDTHSARVSFKHESCGIVVIDGPWGERRRVREAGDADGRGGTPTRASA